jgi:hypothetical protein
MSMQDWLLPRERAVGPHPELVVEHPPVRLLGRMTPAPLHSPQCTRTSVRCALSRSSSARIASSSAWRASAWRPARVSATRSQAYIRSRRSRAAGAGPSRRTSRAAGHRGAQRPAATHPRGRRRSHREAPCGAWRAGPEAAVRPSWTPYGPSSIGSGRGPRTSSSHSLTARSTSPTDATTATVTSSGGSPFRAGRRAVSRARIAPMSPSSQTRTSRAALRSSLTGTIHTGRPRGVPHPRAE